MQIINNTIVYPTHIVVCEPGRYSRAYMEDMLEYFDEYAEDSTPREHARVLRHCNNDGTWGIKVHKGYQPCAIIQAYTQTGV